MKENCSAWYSLRRTLPPWRFEECLADLLEAVQKSAVDEVIIKIDTEEFSHGHPTLEWAKAYQEKLFRVKEELQKLHIAYSLNPWITAGHADRGRNDLEHLPGLECMVGDDGSEAKHNACFLSPVWREYLRKLWKIYAETSPRVMWVEDDIRTFNHEPVSFGCFCPRHLEIFSRRIGRNVGREELVRAILAPGEPHPWRREYLAMQQEIMVETTAFLTEITHTVSPQTAMGLMSSGPRLHCLEYRNWTALADALSDGTQLYSRPPMANYYEDSLRGFYYSQDSIKITRHVLPEGVVELTECENVPFTRYSKSVIFTFLEMAISIAYGSEGITLNLFDHMGTPIADEEHYCRMLAEYKLFLNALKAANTAGGKYAGVQLLHAENASVVKQLQEHAGYQDLAEDGFEMMLALESHGIATTYDPAPVAALAGETARALPDEAIRELLKKGLLLDGAAARILWEREFGKEIGIEEIDPPCHRRDLPFVISAEEFDHPGFGGKDQLFMTATLPFLQSDSKFCRMKIADGAEMVSRWVDPDTVFAAPAMSFYTNQLGGRVAVHALEYKSSFGVSFCNPVRRKQLSAVIDRLADGVAPLRFSCNGAYALAWKRETPGHTVCGVFNLNLDDWDGGTFTLSGNYPAVPEIRKLAVDGSWIPVKDAAVKLLPGGLEISLRENISMRLPLILKIS